MFQEMGISLILDRKLEIGEEGHGQGIEIMEYTMRKFNVTFGSNTRQSALENM